MPGIRPSRAIEGRSQPPAWLVRGFSAIYDAAFEGAPHEIADVPRARQANGRADGEPVAARMTVLDLPVASAASDPVIVRRHHRSEES